MKLFTARNIDVVKLLLEILVLICAVFSGLNVCPGSNAFITVYLRSGCEIALYGVSVLYCDMQVLCVGLVSVVGPLLFSLCRFILLPVSW